MTREPALFPDEATIARAVLGSDAARWHDLVPLFERHGMPKIDPLTGRRYWPAVRACLTGDTV